MECRLFFFLFLFSSAYRAQNFAHKHIEVCTHRPSSLKTSFLRQQSSRANDDNNSTGVILFSTQRSSWWAVHFEASYRIHSILVIVSPNYVKHKKNRVLIMLFNFTGSLRNPKQGHHWVVHRRVGALNSSHINLNPSKEDIFQNAAVLCPLRSGVVLKELYVSAYVKKSPKKPLEVGKTAKDGREILKGIFVFLFIFICLFFFFLYILLKVLKISNLVDRKQNPRSEKTTFTSALDDSSLFHTTKNAFFVQEQTRQQRAKQVKVHKTHQETRLTANTPESKMHIKVVGERLPSTLETDVTKRIDLMSATASHPQVVSSKQVGKKKDKSFEEVGSGSRKQSEVEIKSFLTKMKLRTTREGMEESNEKEEQRKDKNEKRGGEKEEKKEEEGEEKKEEKGKEEKEDSKEDNAEKEEEEEAVEMKENKMEEKEKKVKIEKK